MHPVIRSFRSTILTLALLGASASVVFAQVRELPVAFDSAGMVLVVSPAFADSVGFRAPIWPVAGAYVEARLFKQSEGGYIIAVRRADETVDRYSISLEQFASIRAVLGSRAAPEQPIVAPPVVSEPVEEPGLPDEQTRIPVGVKPELGGRSFANGQVLLASTVYGPALGYAVRSAVDDPLAYYGAYFGTIGASLYMALRTASSSKVSFAQSIESNHAGLHGAAIGAGLAYLAIGEATDTSGKGAYGLGVFAGGVGGALAGFHAARRMTSAEAAASSFGADVGLLLGVASVASRDRFGDNFDRSSVTTMIASTVGGYIAGPLYPRLSPDNVTVGDVVTLVSTGLTGIMAAGTIIALGDQDAERSANLLSAGMLVGIAVGHPFLVRPIDHTVLEGGVLLAAAGGGASAGARLASTGVRNPSAGRVLGIATLGSAVAIFFVERRFQTMDRTRLSSNLHQRPSRVALFKPRLDVAGGLLAASGAPGIHPVLRIAF